jgi:RNA 3'-terminal phosphate cyclase (ATP)
MLTIDGSLGEGGGQVLRTCLSLSAVTGRPFRLINIRAGRRTPGLRPQHLTSVRAAAAICRAVTEGDHLGSTTLTFHPEALPQGGAYDIDVAETAGGGSAGAVTLVLQAIVLPLLFADQPAQVTLRGGTFVPLSPPFHYVKHVFQPALARMGAKFDLSLVAWGWYPQGGGEIRAVVTPIEKLVALELHPETIRQVRGIAAVTNLPAHIPQRMADRAENLLRERRLAPTIETLRDTGRGAGAGIVLWTTQAGFSALGRKGVPAQEVAEAAVAELATFIDNRAAVDHHLADQLLLPMALAHGVSSFTTSRLTQHALTNAALLQQWLDLDIGIAGALNEPGQITVPGVGQVAQTGNHV